MNFVSYLSINDMKQQESQAAPLKNEDLKTMTASMQSLQKQGFTENFMVNEQGLYSVDSEISYKPEQAKIASFYRFEGDSDPADSSILYAIETDDSIRGLLTDSYGPHADPHVARFITEVEDIHKKVNRGEKL